MDGTLVVASENSFHLGEGPVWDPIRSRLLWVDIHSGDAHSGHLLDDGTITDENAVHLDRTVGALGVAPSGDWVVAGAERLLVRTAAGEVSEGPRIVSAGSGRRLNDGAADPAGRYLVGTLSLTGSSASEALVSVDAAGDVRVIDRDLTLSNGLAWTADGLTLYSVDTERRVVFRRAYEPTTGASGDREQFLSFADGFPDGMTIDAEEHLWIAMWGLGEVRRYAPDGALVRRIAVPAPHTSCVAFAGPLLETLVITTATEGMAAEDLAAYPLAGRIFTCRPGVRGLPQPLWSGSLPSASDQGSE